VNANLAAALGFCPVVKAMGWELRCGECHVSTGTYEKGTAVDWHYHHEYQIEIALGGEFQFEIQGAKPWRLRAGEGLFIPWKVVHRWTCRKPGPMLGISLQLLPTRQSIHADGWLTENTSSFSNREIIQEAQRLIKDALKTRHPFGGQTLGARLYLVLAAIFQNVIPPEDQPVLPSAELAELRNQEIVGWVLKHLDENANSKIRLSEISQKAGLSARHLHRLFLKHAGKSLHDYVLERRLDRAREMLREGDKNLMVKEVAFACGFSSLTYFSHLFRSVYGISPTAFVSQNAQLRQRSTVHPAWP